MKQAIRQLAGKAGLGPALGLLHLSRDSALTTSGWFRSYSERRPTDSDGKPLPFMSYAAIHFLGSRTKRDLRVFEFGSGYSTLWWASRVKEVFSCEHDRQWYQQMKKSSPSNVHLLYRDVEISGAYPNSIKEQQERFDVVVIDGRERVACAEAAVSHMSPKGIFVWDDTDRERYKPGMNALLASGYRQLDFIGIGPMLTAMKFTSIFYRADNVLGI